MASQPRFAPSSEGQGLSVRLFDPKFRRDAGPYAAQCLAASVTIFIVLCVLDTLAHTVLIAALGASSFIAFTMPHTHSARPRYLVGGYVVGMIVGCSASVIGAVFIGIAAEEFQHFLAIAFAAAATGGAMFMMTITDTEHPPAAGLALGFAVNEWDMLTVAVVFIGISSISLTKEIFKARLKNLL